ncbi:MAG: cyclopropane-fatty-acyl-phospholipid synthase family protein [Sulfuricaulis sp.]|uniref:SAM-dependent methyltransferase n=1 Tax=Sulfuricaulis sp. TaxID=2003553 RepID=UPI0025CF3B44|nr:cyclopropane-fatty-acyl-phospholipid synthase family protein [Sulfuricaulis sp.]MCR4346440.1 cyclopropane-fatty-acyl-phospholipid synthase family protein [Sulfuricaulis sp.]
MILEQELMTWASCIRDRVNLHARLILWNGQQFDLGHFTTPRIVLRVKSMAAIPYLLNPTLDRLGKAYVKGMIDLEGKLNDIVAIAYAIVSNTVPVGGRVARMARFFQHTRQSDKKAVQSHYDVSNAFYAQWLDPAMVYSCAYFEQGNEDLPTAQMNKIDHILAKIKLQPGQTLLDIGCGWGALVMRAASHYGARCVGITLSKNQYELAIERVKAAGLTDRVAIRLEDYRDMTGRYDRITSVGMFEHVGRNNLPAYFRRMHNLLAEDGMALNHGITSTDPDGGAIAFGGGDFIDEYVFPDGELPHLSQALLAMQKGGLEVIDVENLRRHYAKTLSIWADNFDRHSGLIQQEVDDEQFRIWRVYLAFCAHAFEHDDISVYQVLCHQARRSADSLDWSRRYIYNAQQATVQN